MWFSPGTLVSFTIKADSHDIAEILLKMALNTIALTIYEKPSFFKQIIKRSFIAEIVAHKCKMFFFKFFVIIFILFVDS